MQDIVATGRRLVPARVGGQFGGMEAQALGVGGAGVGLGQGRPDAGLAVQAADRRLDPIALVQQADDAPAADISRTAGDQHHALIAHARTSILSLAIR